MFIRNRLTESFESVNIYTNKLHIKSTTDVNRQRIWLWT